MSFAACSKAGILYSGISLSMHKLIDMGYGFGFFYDLRDGTVNRKTLIFYDKHFWYEYFLSLCVFFLKY